MGDRSNVLDHRNLKAGLLERADCSLTACARAFCETIEEAGYQAGIYFNLSTATQLYRLSELLDYDFWLAEYRETPSYPFAINMWQYTDAGTVPGINAYVDLNLRFG